MKFIVEKILPQVQAYLVLLRRDLKTALHNRQAMVTLFLMPIVLVTLLSFALSGMFANDEPLTKIRMAVVFDFQEQPTATYLRNTQAALIVAEGPMKSLAQIEAMNFKTLMLQDFLSAASSKAPITAKEMTKDKALAAVKAGDLDAAVLFDEDFYGNYIVNTATPLKNPASIQIVTNNNNHLKKQITETLITAFSERMEKTWHIKDLMMQQVIAKGVTFDQETLDETLGNLFDGGLTGNVLTFETQLVQGRKPITAPAYYTMGTLSMFLLFAAGYGTRLMLEEQENHTLQRLKVAGVSKWHYLASKFSLMFTIGMLQLALLVLFSTMVFKVNWGNAYNLLIIAASGSFATSGMGLIIGVYTLKAGNYKFANMLESFFFQVMAFLGGSFIPLTMLPGIFKILSKATPNGLIMNALLINMQGYNMWRYAHDLWILLGMGALFSAIAIMAFTRINVD